MAVDKKFFVDINLQGNALNNATIGTNSDMTKAGSFRFDGVRLEYYNGSTVKQVANMSDIAAVTGGLILQGGYDAATNTPDIADGTAFKGYFWVVTTAGSFLGESVQVGDSLVATVDNAGASIGDWLILQGNVVIATDSVDGIVRLATQAEVDAGTEGGAVVVTPATLQSKIDSQITPEINSKVSKSGDSMTGNLNMTGASILNIGTAYINNLNSPDFISPINLDINIDAGTGNTIINLPAPTNEGDAANKQYVDDQDALKLSLTGGTMSGGINMGGNNINNVGTLGLSQLGSSDGTNIGIQNNIDAAFSSTIINLPTPINGDDAANKTYVDDQAAAAQAAAESYADGLAVNYDPAGAAATAQTNAESFATTAASNAQSNAESFASNAAATAQLNAQTYADSLAPNYDAAGSAATAQSNAEAFATIAASTAASTAQSNAETFATGAANQALSDANTYTDNQIAAQSFSESYASVDWIEIPGVGYRLNVVHGLNSNAPKVTTIVQSMGNVEFFWAVTDENEIAILSNSVPSNETLVGVSK